MVSKISKLWDSFTSPRTIEVELARREYMTNVICLIMMLVSVFFLIIFIIGNAYGIIPLDSTLIVFSLSVFFGFAWSIAHFGHWRIAGTLPAIIIFLVAVYGNMIGGPGAPAMLLYTLAICLTAILQEKRSLWLVTFTCVLAYSIIYWAHISALLSPYRLEQEFFWNRIVIAASSFICLAMLLRFLMSQLQKTILEERAEAERYRALVDTSPDAITLSDLEGNIAMTNAQTLIIHQYDNLNELIGKNIIELILPTDAEKVLKGMKRTIEEGIIKEYEITMVHKDGSPFPAALNAAILHDSQNAPSGFVILTRDIHERKQAEEDLRQSENKFRTIYDLAPIGMTITDLEGRYLSVNKSYGLLLDYSPQELIGLSFAEFSSPDELENNIAARQRLLNGETTFERLEKKYRAKDGRMIYTLLQFSLIRDSKGEPIFFIGQVVDITPLKLAQEQINQLNIELEKKVAARTAQLEAANKEMESFAYSISHDLRAPLRSIDGFSRILEEDHNQSLEDTGVQTLKRIRSASKRMGDMIDSILELSRVTINDLNHLPVDLSNIAASIIEELRMQNPQRNVVTSIEKGLHAQGDERLLRVLLENLLNNAWKFTSKCEYGQISFGAMQDEKVFYIRDNGAGFDMNQAHRLFTAFQRLHTTDEFPGTGIGLATVQRIINRHGGRVWAESALEQGTTIYFTLPNCR